MDVLDQFFAILDVSEDVPVENKKAAVHPNVGSTDIFEIGNDVVFTVLGGAGQSGASGDRSPRKLEPLLSIND